MSQSSLSGKLVASIIIALIVGVVIGYSATTTMMPTGAPTQVTQTVTVNAQTSQRLRIAVIYYNTVEEPWVAAMHDAMTWASQNMNVEYAYTENVHEADIERVIREYIAAGYDTIIPHSWGFQPVTVKLAMEFPNIYFAQGSGPPNATYPPNVVLFDPPYHGFEEAAYLGGVAAGKLTKTNLIGSVAGYDTPDVDVTLNAFAAGARSVNPSVKMKVIFLQSWFDPVAGKQAATALINSGVDVIYAERYGPFEAAQDARKAGKTVWCFGNYVDQNSLAPDVIVGSVTFSFRPMIQTLIQERRAGVWALPARINNLASNGSGLIWNDAVKTQLPADIVTAVESAKTGIISGAVAVLLDYGWDPSKWS